MITGNDMPTQMHLKALFSPQATAKAPPRAKKTREIMKYAAKYWKRLRSPTGNYLVEPKSFRRYRPYYSPPKSPPGPV